jgi:diaminopimelate epimerase
MDGVRFAKGHGTQNDFVLLPDVDGALQLAPSVVRALCDRHRGIGADGVLRVVRAGALEEVLAPGITPQDWFMDYRNADGSIAEMCGNGLRVFAHYVIVSGLEQRREFVVGSRAGARPVVVHAAGRDGDVTVDMGPARQLGASSATVGAARFDGLVIDVGNPHLACVSPDLTVSSLAALDLSAAPTYDTGVFPHGANVELVTAPVDGAVHMRVYERGVGETRSCGTGTVAAALAALRYDGSGHGTVTVEAPGGQVQVRITGTSSFLRGPSVLVGDGVLDAQWWAAQL